MATLLGLVAVSGSVSSAETQEQIAVSVRVLPRTALQVRSAPRDLVISAQDIQRSYLEVEQPTRVRISNNDPRGFLLLVTPRMPGLTALIVKGAGPEMKLSPRGGVIPEPGRTGVNMQLALRYRFVLEPGMPPGRYVWPVRLAVRGLP